MRSKVLFTKDISSSFTERARSPGEEPLAQSRQKQLAQGPSFLRQFWGGHAIQRLSLSWDSVWLGSCGLGVCILGCCSICLFGLLLMGEIVCYRKRQAKRPPTPHLCPQTLQAAECPPCWSVMMSVCILHQITQCTPFLEGGGLSSSVLCIIVKKSSVSSHT